MVRTIAFSLIVIFLNLSIAFPQAKMASDNDFGVTLGLNEYQIRDEVLSDARHRGFLASLGLSYSKLKEISINELKFNLIINTLKSRYETEKASVAVNPSMNYSYLRKARDISKNVNLYLGGIIGWNLHMDFYEEWDESHIYWLNSYFLGISERLSYQKSDKSTINFDINIPVVALVSRPPERFLYKELNPKFSWFISQFHDDLTLTSLHQHFEFNMILEYKYGHPHKFKKSFFWSFSYIKNSMSYSKNVSILTHTFGVSLLF
ncbi:MAG: hypothetical protein ACE5JB_15115 [bacterium]